MTWARPRYSLGMKTWMIAAALLVPGTLFAQVWTMPEVTVMGTAAGIGLRGPAAAKPLDGSQRDELVREIDAAKTALLPAGSAAAAKHAPKILQLREAATAAQTPSAIALARRDFEAWKNAATREQYAENRKANPTETLPAFAARKETEARFVLALRNQFALQREQQTSVASLGFDRQAWTRYFDNSSSRIPFAVSDGAVKADMPTGAARYKKLRDIAVKEWQAPASIVDAAIAESIKQNVDPALVLAVIWQESRFNTKAHSPVGARGLMQVMPDTARGMGYNPDQMWNPKYALEAGVKYLRNAAKYLKLNIDLSDISETSPNKIKALLASYNAGCGAVSKWLRQQGADLVRIPYAETRHYVQVIGAKLASLGERLGWN